MNFPNDINRLLLNLIRKGTVLAVDHATELCRVECGDIQTNWIHWIALAAGATRDWNPPTVGEQVLVLSPGGEMADGVALRGISSDDNPLPSHSPSTHTRTYPDGALVEYDHATHALVVSLPAGATVLIDSPGSVTIKTEAAIVEASTVTVTADSVSVKANTVSIDSPSTSCSGHLAVAGDIAAGGGITAVNGIKATGAIDSTIDVTAGGISLKNHVHPPSTSKPQ